jgi:hypothetical protein
MDGAEAGVSSGPERTLRVREDPDTPRRPRQARKDPGRPGPLPYPPVAGSPIMLHYPVPARASLSLPTPGREKPHDKGRE